MSGTIHFEPEPGERPGGAPPMKVPRAALIGGGALIVFVIGLAASARLFGFGVVRETSTAVQSERTLFFADATDGGILVTDAATHQEAAHIEPGTGGFLRGSLRALTRARSLAHIGREVPFRLVRYTDGRLVLEDPSTGQHITVTSFGPTQVASFDQLLK